jgi:uncharacterized membrane protein YbhN (UPF0104 family)
MKPLYRNVFLAIGVVAIIIMLCTSDLSYSELWDNVRRAGYWFPAVILLWVFLYLANAWSWSVIIHDGAAPKVPFLKIYKYTISGYALNYVTPVGLLGGEPYRIMELTPGGLIDKQCTYDEYLENDEMARKRQILNMEAEADD